MSNKKQKMSSTIKHVLILVAMEAEAKPFVDSLGLAKSSPVHDKFSFETFAGTFRSIKVTVVVNGKCKTGVDNVGTTPAAIAAFAVIQIVQPCLVINAGTAGGFGAKGAKIGDAFVSTLCRHHDRRIPIPGWDDYAFGHHPTLNVPQLCKALGFKQGVVTTGNSLDYTPKDLELMLTNEASVKDMEAAAIAWVCAHYDTPFFALKVVTDIVDGGRPSHEEFLENLGTAAKALQEALPRCLEFVEGKALVEL